MGGAGHCGCGGCDTAAACGDLAVSTECRDMGDAVSVWASLYRVSPTRVCRSVQVQGVTISLSLCPVTFVFCFLFTYVFSFILCMLTRRLNYIIP